MRDAPLERRLRACDGDIVYWEWPGDATAPLVFLLHATGFHGRVWDATVRALPTGFRAIAVDLMGHGRSAPRGAIRDWEEFTPPVVALIDALGLEGALGVGHSMGGFTVALAALRRRRAFGGLLLVDPVIRSPEDAGKARFADLDGPEAHPVARRRDRWPDWETLRDRFQDRLPYSLWRAGTLADYCRHGLRPAPDGDGFVLACAPILEASVYFTSWRAELSGRLGEIDRPVTVLRAAAEPADPRLRTTYIRSPTWPALATAFPRGVDVHRPDLTHFIPMQAPELVADEIAALAGRMSGP